MFNFILFLTLFNFFFHSSVTGEKFVDETRVILVSFIGLLHTTIRMSQVEMDLLIYSLTMQKNPGVGGVLFMIRTRINVSYININENHPI